mmetsp:Transcript_88041/g.139070  ORF Transcript_88041/g.139070 Transcript_88041/m.139070 type:complete len:146 (-) Transcript_88041:1269-1706(-)
MRRIRSTKNMKINQNGSPLWGMQWPWEMTDACARSSTRKLVNKKWSGGRNLRSHGIKHTMLQIPTQKNVTLPAESIPTNSSKKQHGELIAHIMTQNPYYYAHSTCIPPAGDCMHEARNTFSFGFTTSAMPRERLHFPQGVCAKRR